MNRTTLCCFVIAATISGCADQPTEPPSGAPAQVEPGIALQTVEPGGADDDREALTALYEATGGPDWLETEGWLTDAPLGSWHGVDTANNGRVYRLNLGQNDLAGEIPAEVGDLAGLMELVLPGNRLTGKVPAEVGDLASLAVLDLGWNDLTGEIPATLAGLSNLQTAYWERNAGLCAPGTRQFIEFAEGLEEAEGPFCHEADVAVLESLYNWTDGPNWRLSDGWLQPGPLSDWHGVATDSVAGRVVALDLSGNGLSGALPGSLLSLKTLRELRVDGNSALGGRLLLGMTALPLRTLRYDGTGLCAPAAPSFHSWLQSIASHAGNGVECPPLTDREVLETLYRSAGGLEWGSNDNWMTDSPLGEWYGVSTDDQGRVTNLSLGYNGLTGKIPAELSAIDSLAVLVLYGNGLTGEIPPELGGLTSLGWLYLADNQLTGEVPPELGNLANLKKLILYGNGLTGEIPPELGNLVDLRGLSLYDNGLTGEIPPELGNFPDLVWLDLSDNGLTGEIPPELGNLASLRELILYDNGLTGEVPAELGDLADLSWLDLSVNGLTGEVPEELGDLADLERLHLSHNAGMSGALPSALASLDLLELMLGGTGLCVPRDDAVFRSWLRSIPIRRVSQCREPAAGGAVAAAYIVQAVQSFEFPVPLVAGKPGLLRVFVSAPEAGDARAPAARATFYQKDGSRQTVEVPSGSATLSAELQEGNLEASANVKVPGRLLRPGVEMVVEVDPRGVLDPGLGVPRRIPATGRTALDLHQMPSFDVTVVPFLWESDPDSSILDATEDLSPEDTLFEETRRLLPVGAMSVNVHEPVWTSSRDAFGLLDQTEMIRTVESGGGYWMGTFPNPVGAAGVAGVPGRSMFAIPRPSVVAHEFGHNFNLLHAPCGGAGGPDPAYPNRRGQIGAWGWDRRSGKLVPPARVDLMSYCDPAWIGDYHFANSLRWRMREEAGVAAFAGPPTRVLLLWGGADADGKPFLYPAFVVDSRASLPEGAGEWRIVGEAEDGRPLFDRRFDMAEVADGDGRSSFVLALPVQDGWADALARIVLTGAEGFAEIDADSGPAMSLLLDASTGRVRGILRDRPATAAALPDAAGAVREREVEVRTSRGVPAPDAWRR